MDHEKPLKVPIISEEEAIQLFRVKVKDDIWDGRAAAEIVRDIDCLPLAIVHAAAYIRLRGITVAQYRDRLELGEEDITELLSTALQDRRRGFDSSPPVMGTWNSSFEQIRSQNPRAVEILAMMAVLNRHAVPEILLRQSEERDGVFQAILHVLLAFWFIESQNNPVRYSIYGLVRRAILSWLDASEMCQAVDSAVQALLAAFQDTRQENWTLRPPTSTPYGAANMQPG